MFKRWIMEGVHVSDQNRTFEFGPDVGELLVDALQLGLFGLAIPDVRNEHRQPAHSIALHCGHFGWKIQSM